MQVRFVAAPRWHNGMSLTLVAALAGALAGGCPQPQPNDNGGNDNADVPFLDAQNNSSIDTATKLTLQSSSGVDRIKFAGAIAAGDSLDVYDLGELAPGDEVTIDVTRTSGDLDAVAAVFDAGETLMAFNDDRTPDGSNLDPRIEFTLRGDAGTYFLGISAFGDSNSTGDYEVSVEVRRNSGTPNPAAQVVFLDWNGGDGVRVENVGVFDLQPFDAADVGLSSSQTALFKQKVQQIVSSRYDGLDLILLNSDDDDEPAFPHSTVYFGGNNRRAFAISEQVDSYNGDPSDDTIIFTESFQGAFFSRPTFEQMASAVGNTVAHEIGHLLGLVHTADCSDLMDTSCGNDRLLQEQRFRKAVLDFSVFPIGVQDSAELLAWILGGE